jgi:hypothetical protein
MGVGGQRHAPASFTPGKDPVPIVQEAGWAPGPVWIGAENLAPTGIQSPDLPACSELAQIHKTQYLNHLTQVFYVQHVCFGSIVPLTVLLCSVYEKSLPILGIFIITLKII